jgi:hypothetical protein
VPKVRNSEVADAINEAFVLADMFRADREYRGWFATRPLGMLRVPSSTGDQEDFGAVKGGNAGFVLPAGMALGHAIFSIC